MILPIISFVKFDIFWKCHRNPFICFPWCCTQTSRRTTLRWRHNGHDSVSNHQPHHCLLNRLFGCRSKKTSKLRVTGLCAGNSPGPVISPHKGPVTRKMFPFDDVIMIGGDQITVAIIMDSYEKCIAVKNSDDFEQCCMAKLEQGNATGD